MDESTQREEPRLKQELRWYQIFFIVISAVIGEGIFYNNGPALEVAGPAGLLVAFFIVGFITIMVMEGISELVQLFPAPNAVYEYVRAFVDEDLAWVSGITYWYIFAVVVANQNIAAGDHAAVFLGSNPGTWQIIGFYIVSPIVLTMINMAGVKWYGWIETVGGVLKIVLVLLCAVLLYVIAGTGNTFCPSPNETYDGVMSNCDNTTTSYIVPSFEHNTQYAGNNAQAVMFAIPIVIYSFLSMECFVVTAYEAKAPRDLRIPSKWIAYVVFMLYLLCTIGEAITVRWFDGYLPPVYAGLAGNPFPPNSTLASSTVVIIAAARARNAAIRRRFPRFLSGCLVFSNLSSANTTLYLGSRTLYGLARAVPPKNRLGRWIHKLSVVEPRTGVPIAALIVTTLSFAWVPFLRTKSSQSRDETIQVISESASICTLMVWGVLCLAFIRYVSWLGICEDAVRDRYPELDRKSIKYQHHTMWRQLQPLPAWVGLIGSIFAFALASGSMWRSSGKSASIVVSNAASAYGAPVILLVFFILLKIANFKARRDSQKTFWGWVKLSPNSVDFEDRLWRLRYNKHVEMRPPNDSREDVSTTALEMDHTKLHSTRQVVSLGGSTPSVRSVSRDRSEIQQVPVTSYYMKD